MCLPSYMPRVWGTTAHTCTPILYGANLNMAELAMHRLTLLNAIINHEMPAMPLGDQIIYQPHLDKGAL